MAPMQQAVQQAVQQVPADATESTEAPVAPGSASTGKRRLVVAAVLAVVVLALAGAAAWYFLRASASSETAAEAAPTAAAHKSALYVNLRPDFIVNSTAVGQRRYLQTNVVVMARDPAVVEALNTHQPVVRSALINLLADQDFMVLQTDAGKQALREQMRGAIDATLQKEANVSGVESVLFASFVMQ